MDFERFASPNWLSTTLSASSRSRKPPTNFIDEANFGTHWDENRAKFDSVRDSLRNGLLLQGAALSPERKEYNHGGLNYLLIWAGLTPEVLRFLIVGPHTLESLSRTINPVLYTTTVRVRVRAIYVVLSGLCIVWSFGLVLLLCRSRMEALLA